MPENKKSNIDITELFYQPDINAQYVTIEKFCGLFPIGQVSIIAAEAGTGKSWFVQYCMIQASKGLDIYGNETEVQSSLCFKGEMATEELTNRFALVRNSGYDISKMRYVLSNDVILKGGVCSLSDQDFRAIVHASIQQCKPNAVIFDSFGFFNTCDENSMKEMTELYQWLLGLANDYSVAVILTHHLRKKSNMDKGKGRSMDDISGSSAITRYSSTIYMMHGRWLSSSSSYNNGDNGIANPKEILVTNDKSSGIEKPPFIFTMESREEDTDERSKELTKKSYTTFKIRDANNEDMIPVNQETITQGNIIKVAIKNIMLGERRDMTTSEIITKIREYVSADERIIKGVLKKMSDEGEHIVRLEQKKGREFVYALPEDTKAELRAGGLTMKDEHDDDDKGTRTH